MLGKKLDLHWTGIKKTRPAVKQAPFYVIKHTKMPSLLIEVGFITHPVESNKLTQHDYQQQIVNDIFKAVIDYKQQIDQKNLYIF